MFRSWNKFKINRINSLNYKESNRLKVIKKELLKFNASVKIKDNVFFLDTSELI